jgi:hypothetical protein
LEKEFISLDPHSFDRIEDYLVCEINLVEIGRMWKELFEEG